MTTAGHRQLLDDALTGEPVGALHRAGNLLELAAPVGHGERAAQAQIGAGAHARQWTSLAPAAGQRLSSTLTTVAPAP